MNQHPDEAPILVTMTGTDERGEQVSLSTDGLFSETEDGFLVRFLELHPDSDTPIQTLLDAASQQVTIVRVGHEANVFVFRQGETYETQYETPIGAFYLRIFATEVRVRRRGLNGDVRMRYQVMTGKQFSDNSTMEMRKLNFRFRPCKA